MKVGLGRLISPDPGNKLRASLSLLCPHPPVLWLVPVAFSRPWGHHGQVWRLDSEPWTMSPVLDRI